MTIDFRCGTIPVAKNSLYLRNINAGREHQSCGGMSATVACHSFRINTDCAENTLSKATYRLRLKSFAVEVNIGSADFPL